MKKLTRTEKSWILYDWANSSFATTVMAGFFPLFFQKYWNAGQSAVDATARLGLSLSISGIIASVLTLYLGPLTDLKAQRKLWTVVFAIISIVAVFLLPFFEEGQWQGPVILYTVALTGFTLSCNFYDSLLPHVVGEKNENHIGWISSLGYGFGYLGGGILFFLNVIIFLKPDWLGLADGVQAVKASFASVAVWWAVFSIPLLKNVKEQKTWDKDFLFGREIFDLFGQAFKRKKLFYFLLAFWFYIDGVYTVMSMAVDFGTGIGLEGKHLMAALLMTQFVAFPATLLSSKISNNWGTERTLIGLIGIYIIAVIGATQLTTALEFFLLAGLIGLAQGGVQSLSRSQMAVLVPREESGKWYALMNLVGRFAAVLGPLVVAITTKLTESHRTGVGAINILLLIGIYFLFKSTEADGASS